MRAIVCDVCGTVVLLDDHEFLDRDGGVFRYMSRNKKLPDIDVCDACVEKMLSIMRGESVDEKTDPDHHV